MSATRKCPGFEDYCGEPLKPWNTWTISGTAHRDEWNACEECAMQALRYTHSEVFDPGGEQWLEEHAS